jgi:transcription elongation factor Elf1
MEDSHRKDDYNTIKLPIRRPYKHLDNDDVGTFKMVGYQLLKKGDYGLDCWDGNPEAFVASEDQVSGDAYIKLERVDEPKMLPCPLCGRTNVGIIYYPKRDTYGVTCHECTGVNTKGSRSKQGAINNWNTRPAKPFDKIDEPKLLPCPFCGTTNINVTFSKKLFWVTCEECYNKHNRKVSTYSFGKKRSIDNWNIRAEKHRGIEQTVLLEAYKSTCNELRDKKAALLFERDKAEVSTKGIERIRKLPEKYGFVPIHSTASVDFIIKEISMHLEKYRILYKEKQEDAKQVVPLETYTSMCNAAQERETIIRRICNLPEKYGFLPIKCEFTSYDNVEHIEILWNIVNGVEKYIERYKQLLVENQNLEQKTKDGNKFKA